ncbi:MAG: hypothetical protein HGA31_03615 [Candidatus Moranbacteria bacterium]|nr:hypothetical protein [Candidatus Moranbacteria bacterium]
MITSPNDADARGRRIQLQGLQSEHVILDQEFKKKSRRLEAVVLEIRHIDRDMARMKMEAGAKKDEEEKLKREVQLLDVELKRVKKKINLIS